MNYAKIFRIVGRILSVEAVFMLPALIISAVNGERAAAGGFVVGILLSLALGMLLSRLKPRRQAFFAREGLVAVGLAWIAVSLVGTIPYFISGAIPNIVDCLFESVSGFTTTGATILRDIEALPVGILYWRSFSHWLGGMGVLVFVLAIGTLTKGEAGTMHLMRAESTGPTIGKLVPRLSQSARILYGIYIGMTVLMVLLLLVGRVPFFDSLTIAFSAVGTGGFSIKNASMAAYSDYAQLVTSIFMILCSINFNLYYLLMLREFKRVLKNEELRLYLGLIAAAVIVISINVTSTFPGAREAVHHVFFQVASIISTTGFATVDYDIWPEFSRTLLLVLTAVGAMAGSTGGGLKVVRLLMLVKSVRRAIYKTLRPNEVRLIHMSGELVEDETVKAVSGFAMIYIFTVAAGLLLISFNGFDFETNFSAMLGCVSNVGPGLGLVGPSCTYADFSMFSKLVLCVGMLLGRLEFFPILILFTPSVWKK